MVLEASDELRHPHDPDDFFWRESVYFNFADATNGLGGWIYLWVVPNKPLKTGMLVSVYSGMTPSWNATDEAMSAPGHVRHGEDGSWVYCVKHDIPELIEADFDDVEVCGLRLRRKSPLQEYAIEFTDDAGTRLELTANFSTRPWDYSDGVHPTPTWVATNRYHRSWVARGELVLGGKTYAIATTGDSDHSWGTRNTVEYATHTFKMWSFQTPDGSRSISAIRRDNGLCFGFINVDGELAAIEHVESSARFDEAGVQYDLTLTVRDIAGREVSATMDRMFSAIGHGQVGSLWGYEGVGTYTVAEWGSCTGVSSFFWPPTFTGAALHEDPSIQNP